MNATHRQQDASSATSVTPWRDRLETAKYLTVSPRTLDLWKAENLVPFRKIGRRVMFHIEQVEAALSKFDHHAAK